MARRRLGLEGSVAPSLRFRHGRGPGSVGTVAGIWHDARRLSRIRHDIVSEARSPWYYGASVSPAPPRHGTCMLRDHGAESGMLSRDITRSEL